MRTLIVCALALLSVGCSTEPDFETLEIYPYQAHLVSVSTGRLSLAVKIEVGPDGCHQFDEMRSSKVDSTQQLRFYAKHTLKSLCTTAFVYFEDTLHFDRIAGVRSITLRMQSGKDETIPLPY